VIRFGGRGALLVVASAAVVAAVVAGLWAIGSPGQERRRRLDGRRVDDLRALAAAVDRYTADHRRLPASLDELLAGTRWSLDTRDPETRAPYEYRVVDDSTFEVCATYLLSLEEVGLRDKRWAHGAGWTCHRLVVDRSPPSGEPPWQQPIYRD